jgi:hypothetical protein
VTNFITILTAASGTAFAKLLPGEACVFRLDVAAPAVLADTAIVVIDYLVLPV